MFVVNFKLDEFKKGIIQLSSWIASPLLKSGEVLATTLDLRTYAKARDEALIPPPPPSVNHVLSGTVTDLRVTFNVAPNCAGSLDYGDGTAVFAWTATTTGKTHDYATAGTYTATFTPTDTNDTGSSVAVTATDPAPPPAVI
jgi:PKD repeat protein